ncbi:hypothetical protein CSUI_001188, partial [Cystoisospora suis]
NSRKEPGEKKFPPALPTPARPPRPPACGRAARHSVGTLDPQAVRVRVLTLPHTCNYLGTSRGTN